MRGAGASFPSVYIHDTDYATQTHTSLGNSTRLKEALLTLLTQLTHMLHECNPYV